MLKYRIGLPGWKLAARAGAMVTLRIHLHYDEESKSYWADSPDLDGLAAAGDTLDELREQSLAVAGELVDIAVGGKPHDTRAYLQMRDKLACPA